jgi:hypothetical protein
MVISMNSGVLDLNMRRKVSFAAAGAGSDKAKLVERGAGFGVETAADEKSRAKISGAVAALQASFE